MELDASQRLGAEIQDSLIGLAVGESELEKMRADPRKSSGAIRKELEAAKKQLEETRSLNVAVTSAGELLDINRVRQFLAANQRLLTDVESLL